MVAVSDGFAFAQAVEQELARMPVCHISRHPLDGLRVSEHACPLLVADAATPRLRSFGTVMTIPSRVVWLTGV